MLKNDAVRLGTGWLAETHGWGFLVLHAGKGSAVGRSSHTPTAPRNVETSAALVENSGSMEIGIMPLAQAQSRKTFVCIGRLDGNDVCLARCARRSAALHSAQTVRKRCASAF